MQTKQRNFLCFLCFLCLVCFVPRPGWGAITAVGSIATANEKTSDASFAFTTSAQLDAGNLGVCVFGADNIGTETVVETNTHTSVTDDASNTWTKSVEITDSDGAASDYGTVSVWWTVAASNLSSGGTITLSLSASITAKAVSCHEYTKGGGTSIASWLYHMVQNNNDYPIVAWPQFPDTVPRLNREYLLVRADVGESNTTTYTADTNYTAFTHTSSTTSGGALDTNIGARGEYRILTTGAAQTTDPTGSGTFEALGLSVEFHEYTGWDIVGGIGHVADTVSDTTIVIGNSTQVEVGRIPICIGASDNDGNGTDTDDWVSFSDTQGNSWTIIGQNEADPGAANAGAAVAIAAVLDGVTTQINAGDDITATVSANRTAKALTCLEFFVPSSHRASSVGTEQKEDSTSQAGSLTVGSLANREHLCVRGIAEETNSTTTDLTLTASFGRLEEDGTTGGGAAANMTVLGEFIIFTGTSCASDPATPNAGDQASSMIALDEDLFTPPAFTPTRRRAVVIE